MKHLWTVIKKDLDKIFRNRSMVFSTVILPGLLIFLIYTFMGTSFAKYIDETESELDTRISNVVLYNVPESFNNFATEELLTELKLSVTYNQENDNLETHKDQVLNETIDAVVVFESDFDNKIGLSNPKIDLFYNPTSNFSTNTYSKLQFLLTSYKEHTLDELLSEQGISSNLFQSKPTEVFSEQKSGGMVIAGILPMLIVTFIFSGCLAIGADSIAGEKERGTLATLLMAPVKRNNIIGGKIISTTIIAISAAISSFIGIMGSLPFAKELFIPGDLQVKYEIIDYLGIFIFFLIVAFIASSLVLIASTLGRNIKEATSYAMPFFIVAILVSVISMFATTLPDDIIPYLIPLYNATLGLKGILLFQLELKQFLLIVLSSIAFIILIIILLVKMFKSEKVLFSK